MITQLDWPSALHVALNMRAEDFAEVMATRWSDSPYDFAADCMRLPGPKLAAFLPNGEPVAMGGVATHHPGCAQAWLVGTDKIGEMGVEIAHTCRKAIQALFSEGGVHRVQAHSAEFHKSAHRWLEAIGLREEARLPSYGKGGEDFLVFGITKGD